MDNIIKEVLETYIKKNCLNEINYVAKNSPITICSLEDFISICNSLNINDSNVEDFYGKYCFIEIGSTKDRCVYDAYLEDGYEKWNCDGNKFYEDGQFYFKSEHINVLKLEFDDIINNEKNKKGLTTIMLSPKEVRQGIDYNFLPNIGKSSKNRSKFSYPNAKAFSMELAERSDEFIENNIANNLDVKFIIHCRQGRSRSAAMGYYIAKRLKIDINKYFAEYEQDKTYVNDEDMNDIRTVRSSQFRLGSNGDGKFNRMNHRVSTMMNAANAKRNGNDELFNRYNVIGDEGEMIGNVKADKSFYDDLNNYMGDKNNPRIYNKLKGYSEK